VLTLCPQQAVRRRVGIVAGQEVDGELEIAALERRALCGAASALSGQASHA
jgi:hypothetical protein